MKLMRVLVMGAMAATLGAVGCSHDKPGNLAGLGLHTVNPFAPDTTPRPPGPPPPPIPAQFLGSDSTHDGQTGNTRWRIGNPGNTATIHWSLGIGSGWSGTPWPVFPIEGDIRVMAHKEKDLTIPVAVPAGTVSGLYPLRLLVTIPGDPPVNADGFIRVFSDSVPPPPPPPPTPAVEFAGLDSLPQPTTTYWFFFNESDQPFQQHWTLTSGRNWPGFPITGGFTFTSGGQRDSIGVGIPIPDTAAAGFNRLTMTVTRPNGLPPESAQGDFPINK